jgi:serine/threonine protein kinase
MTGKISPWAQLLSQRGEESAKAAESFSKAVDKGKIEPEVGEAILKAMADTLSTWSDANSARVIEAVKKHLVHGNSVDAADLARWIRSHEDSPDLVVECLAVDPPEDISVIEVLSQAGSQKVVYLADWSTVQREIVLKRFIGEDADKLMPREMLPHPLSMEHPNIIETHPLSNTEGERFLVERRLNEVLSDEWCSSGVGEAANLLNDIGSALAFLQNRGLVHGDVKPDNIGYEGRKYVLLDFGICRPVAEFTDEITATGSLRTRAPELLTGGNGHSPKSDVWALGATVFNACVGRFPLFEEDEAPPRVSHPEERTEYERKLAKRVEDWDEWVKRGVAGIDHEGLRKLVGDALALEADRRPDAQDLVAECKQQLAAFVRGGDRATGLSVAETIRQLSQYLASAGDLRLMPSRRRGEVVGELDELGKTRGLSDEQKEQLEKLKRPFESEA